MPLHVAFLRGVGGPNVVFGVGRKRKPPVAGTISAMLEGHFGYPLPAILRSGEAVAAMVADNPFGDVDAGRFTRFIAMLGETAPPVDALAEPASDAGYAVVARRGRDLFFVIDRERARTPEVMTRLDRAFSKAVTTRNWSTMERVAAVIAG